MHLVADRLRLPRVAARRDDEEVRVVAHRPHVEDRDVGRQLLLAEGGDAAGLLERCQVGQLPRVGRGGPDPWIGGRQCSGGSRAQTRRDTARAARSRRRPQAGRGRRSADRARRARGSPTTRPASGGIGNSSTRSGRDSEAMTRSSSSAIGARAASPRRAVRARARGRAASRRERGELVGADQEDGVVEPQRLERVDRARERVERASAPSIAANASSASSEPGLGGVSTSLWPGSATTRTSRRSSPKWSIASRASATWPLCGGSKAPPRIPTATAHCQIMTSSPISTSAPGLTPAARSASSSSSPSGARADDAEALAGAEDRDSGGARAASAGSRGTPAAPRRPPAPRHLLGAEREEQAPSARRSRRRSRTRRGARPRCARRRP